MHVLRLDDCLQAELKKCIGNSVSDKVANIYKPILSDTQTECKNKIEELKQNMKKKFDTLVETTSSEVGQTYQPRFNEVQAILHDKRMELGELTGTIENITEDIVRLHRVSSSRHGKISAKQGLEEKITEYLTYQEHVKELWNQMNEPLRQRYLFLLQVEESLPDSKALLKIYNRSMEGLL